MAADQKAAPNFVGYGTPLEPLEEDEPLKKPIPLHEQTVRDEKGRYQRFHGAFTGGFSAGYFNTVGSKEGWSPATFKSSRQQKAEKQQARPEDFMDEEDFGEHGIAPREITTQEEFWSRRADPVQERAKAINAQAGLIPGDTLLGDLIAPARSSVGVELLRRMGWREGQGVGPRVKKRPRRRQTDGARVYGCALPPAGSEESEEDDDDFAPENVTFAPKDVTPVDFTPRVGVQGLGYCGLDPGQALRNSGPMEHINLFSPQTESRGHLFGEAGRGQPQRRRGVVGQAFGVGALEDEDEDVYARDCISRYDTVLKDEEPGDGLYGWTAPEEYTRKTAAIRSRDAAYLGRILEGFTLAQTPLEKKQIFAPPTLPKDYRPLHRRPAVHVSRLYGVSPALAEAMAASKGHMVPEQPQQVGRHQLDSSQRRGLLGEDGLKGPTSVMDLLRPEDRERLLRVRAATGQGPAPPPEPPAVPQPPVVPEPPVVRQPRILPQPGGFPQFGTSAQEAEALSAWKGRSTSHAFKPFEKNPSKQARYEQYLERLRQGERDALDQSLDEGMTEWERSREKEEFVRASILYRPSSSSMLSSRFTRGAQADDDDTVEVHPETQDLDDKKAAVRMKMFGQLTRETLEFHPDKVLCKRFNVPHPYPGSSLVGVPKVRRDKFSVFNFLTVTDPSTPSGPVKPTPAPVKKSRWDMSDQDKKDSLVEKPDSPEVKEEPPTSPAAANTAADRKVEKESESEEDEDDDEEEEEEEEVEEEIRPPMDLFKAIFSGSSSSSEDSEEEDPSQEEVQDQKEADPQPFNLFSISSSSSAPPSSLATSAPPPAVIPPTATQPSSQNPINQHTEAAASCRSSTLDEEEFGPKLPPSFHESRGGASEVTQDRGKKNKKHKHKKDKKKKKHKSKHKKKQKKKSKEAESESSEESSQDEDSADALLKRLKSIREANRK
ncbi:G patch domain-containing protein 1 [Synchiropus splendidus]|uniref:G patch domain-containing protein 1 n=1 Tax=Synchiropus splendidus TaxID=270530 RepID=UPI00237E499F|nr:G patch domain-containing protein 1 [Synchiropus splendidus]